MKLTDNQEKVLNKLRSQGSKQGFSKAEYATILRIKRDCAANLKDYFGDHMPGVLKLYIELNND